ncbi:MAG: dihydrofolate reductase [Flavobacteriales bacterium]|nr:dihydrofolate reductase [Flavobacteriales bacterium]
MSKAIVSIIAAVAENDVIGKDNDLIWHIPADLKFFKDTTAGHHVIMGRKNYDSIPDKYRPLPGRTNVIVTRNKEFKAENCLVFHTLQDAINNAISEGDKEPFVIGGGQIYKLALAENLVDRMYLSHVHEEFEGDTFFPKFETGEWNVVSTDRHEIDEKNPHAFTVKVYEK